MACAARMEMGSPATGNISLPKLVYGIKRKSDKK